MSAISRIHHAACASCRLRSIVAAKQLARSRGPAPHRQVVPTGSSYGRSFATSTVRRSDRFDSKSLEALLQELDIAAKEFELSGVTRVTSPLTTRSGDFDLGEADENGVIYDEGEQYPPEEVARRARQAFGHALPEGLLNEEAYKAYVRMFGEPVAVAAEEEEEAAYGSSMGLGELDEEADIGTGILKEGKDGSLEELEFDPEEHEALEGRDDMEGLEAQLQADIDNAMRAGRDGAQEVDDEVEEDTALYQPFEEEEPALDEPADFQRTHPLTLENRFSTSPSTVQLPKYGFVKPINLILSAVSTKHLADAAHRTFGGVGFPYSPSNPAYARTLPQKPIALDASQGKMSEMEADTFLAACMPQIYATVMSTVVETRKRLGSAWLENLLTKEGGPKILDAGGAGAGVMAVREVLRAEWERMHEDLTPQRDVAEASGQTGGAPLSPPTGRATVLTGSDTLRARASALLDDTTFLPRLPDYVHASDHTAAEKGKFDIIIASHTLWPMKEDFLRKQHIANLWSLLNQDGGVLVLIEKGVPRGFEMVAAAREMLIDTRIASPGAEEVLEELSAPGSGVKDGVLQKEKGMIVAPCTNHSSCPMWQKGSTKGRKDLCHFEQRYIRPPFLQKMLGAKDKNHEDVSFSYLSVMRGRDLRDEHEEAITQGDEATDRAFVGYEDMSIAPTMAGLEEAFDPTAPAVADVDEVYGQPESTGPHSLRLPRMILPPLKRTGHVILDVCTPSGTLERWTVPRSFSKQAFRDARKSSWGDLWALGAKTRIPRNVRLGRGKEELGGVDKNGVVNVKGRVKNRPEEGKRRGKKGKNVIEVGYDSEGRIKEEDIQVKTGGRMREGKIKGIRDKRDKTGGLRNKQLEQDLL